MSGMRVTTFDPAEPHSSLMPKKQREQSRGPGWYAAQWLDFAGLKQVDLIKATGWSKSRVSALISGDERYNEDVLREFARTIGCSPGALIDINPATEEGRIMARLVLTNKARRSA